ncbi:MAG: PKD domain-containing protein, partial [Bacteroidota bacterium]
DFDSAPGSTTSASVTIFRGENGDIFDTQYLSAPSTTPLDLNPGNECVKIPPGLEVEDGLYTFRDIDLPIGTESYYIVYQRCCRTEVLTNINDPGNSGATYFIEITPIAQQICNNSPVFNDIPPFIICAQETFSFDASANDVEGHRLEYGFCSPFLGGGPDNQNPRESTGIAPDPDAPPPFQEVNFIGPTYSADQPLGAASNFTIDPNTGMMSGIPVIEGQFVVGLCVREFDENNNLISETRRDFQFLVADCEKNIEVDIASDAVQTDGSYLINSCMTDQVDIANNSTQSDDVAGFFWEFEINGNTQTITDFSPTIDFPAPGTYDGRFIITAVTGCVDTGIVQVNVIDRIVPEFEVVSDPCEDFTTQFNNTSTVPATSTATWDWNFGDSQGISAQFAPSYTYASAGTRTVQLRAITDGICVDSVQQVVDFYPLPADLSISSLASQGCAPQTVSFSIASAVLTDAYSVSWDLGDGTQQPGLAV